ncbi:flagellar hook-basal body complex protein FliE [Marinimicrobium sp. ARAG 43.8]|uniref:flagellar hook-basal body complex protein FliE n=1 Tax=Marinimicrobium sp. ARAG 43.8 TaxID=3418719 RepID=UPI003CFB0889
MTDRVDINRLLVEMRSLKAQTQAFQKPEGLNPEATSRESALRVGEARDVPGFSEVMSQAINKVNDIQKASGDLQDAYERGEAGVDITDVMVASQKSSVAFQATLQVRNKLVEAYRDIMNMPI